MKSLATALIVVAGLGAGSAAWALTGTVVAPDKTPLKGVRVCYLLASTESLCAETDKRGFFELPDSRIDRVRLTADGFMPLTVAAVTQNAALVLDRAASILVRLRDAAGEPIGQGEIYLIHPSGERKGPFPVNVNGVRVRTLKVGRYLVVAHSEGYVQQRSVSVTLESSREYPVDVVLESDQSPSPDSR